MFFDKTLPVADSINQSFILPILIYRVAFLSSVAKGSILVIKSFMHYCYHVANTFWDGAIKKLLAWCSFSE